MKLHNSLVEELITLYEVNSGWPEQRKLREALAALQISIYNRADGSSILVSTKSLNKKMKDLKG
jgi:hypothetical protein